MATQSNTINAFPFNSYLMLSFDILHTHTHTPTDTHTIIISFIIYVLSLVEGKNVKGFYHAFAFSALLVIGVMVWYVYAYLGKPEFDAELNEKEREQQKKKQKRKKDGKNRRRGKTIYNCVRYEAAAIAAPTAGCIFIKNEKWWVINHSSLSQRRIHSTAHTVYSSHRIQMRNISSPRTVT